MSKAAKAAYEAHSTAMPYGINLWQGMAEHERDVWERVAIAARSAPSPCPPRTVARHTGIDKLYAEIAAVVSKPVIRDSRVIMLITEGVHEHLVDATTLDIYDALRCHHHMYTTRSSHHRLLKFRCADGKLGRVVTVRSYDQAAGSDPDLILCLGAKVPDWVQLIDRRNPSVLVRLP